MELDAPPIVGLERFVAAMVDELCDDPDLLGNLCYRRRTTGSTSLLPP